MTSQLFSFCAGKCIDIRYIDKWLNTVNAPSGSPTQSPTEGAGGLYSKYILMELLLRNKWVYQDDFFGGTPADDFM